MEIQIFGTFYIDNNGVDHVNISDARNVFWPQEFYVHDVIPPRSQLIRTYKLIQINVILFYCICILIGISTVFVVICIVSTLAFRKRYVIKSVSWRLNIFVCIGCLFAYTGIILYEYDNTIFDYCNAEIWLLCIGFTLIFMPLFLKTFRLAKIFQSFEVKTITDYTQEFVLPLFR